MSVATVMEEIRLAQASGDTTVQDFGSQGVAADVIAESTAATGVTVDSVVLKDGGATMSGTTVRTGGDKTAMVAVTDATTYTVLAANSGKVHIIPDLTDTCVLSLPTAAAGLLYEFWGAGVAVETKNWTFDTGTDTNFYLGGFVELDTTGATVVLEVPDGDSNSICTVVTPGAGTLIKMYCDGTNWFLNGTIHSETADAVTWADQS